MVSGLFSYPAKTLAIYILFILSLSTISSFINKNVFQNNLTSKNTRILAIILALFSFLILMKQTRPIHYLNKWQMAYQLFESGNKHDALKQYHDLLPKLKNQSIFLYNYGSSLAINGSFQEALHYILQAREAMNHYDFYKNLGNIHISLGNYARAEYSYKKAGEIIPCRLYPKYKLFEIKNKNGNRNEAIELANEILETRIKVESEKTNQMINQIIEFLNKNNSHTTN